MKFSPKLRIQCLVRRNSCTWVNRRYKPRKSRIVQNIFSYVWVGVQPKERVISLSLCWPCKSFGYGICLCLETLVLSTILNDWLNGFVGFRMNMFEMRIEIRRIVRGAELCFWLLHTTSNTNSTNESGSVINASSQFYSRSPLIVWRAENGLRCMSSIARSMPWPGVESDVGKDCEEFEWNIFSWPHRLCRIEAFQIE